VQRAKPAHEFTKEKAMSNQIEPNRVLNRMGARQLTEEEVESVSAAGPPCQLTFTHLPKGGSDEDTFCP
jgi:hypothetical protein